MKILYDVSIAVLLNALTQIPIASRNVVETDFQMRHM